jgi:methionyl-tRNA synthetase
MWYAPEDFVGMQTTFVVNLEPRKMMGLESQGMIFALGLDDDKKAVFLQPKESVENGEGAR